MANICLNNCNETPSYPEVGYALLTSMEQMKLDIIALQNCCAENAESGADNQTLTIAGKIITISRGNSITLPNIVTTYNESTKALTIDGTTVTLTGITGNTDLSYTAAANQGIVVSSTGNDAIVPLASGSTAGLISPVEKTKLALIAITQPVDLDFIESAVSNLNALSGVSVNSAHLGTFTGTSISDSSTVKGALQQLETVVETKQAGLQFQDEGVVQGTTGTVTAINFTGTPVTLSRTGDIVTVDISGTGGGGSNTDLTYTSGASTGTVASSTGTDAVIPAATTSIAGLLTATDKAKLDTIDFDAELNTVSNIGTSGVGVYKQKTGSNFELKKLNAGSSKITITDDTVNNEIDIDVAVANLTGIAQSQITDLVADLAAKQTVIQFQDEGINQGSAGGITTVNFTGATVTADDTGNILNIDVTGGGGGGVTNLTYTSGASTGTVNSDTGTDAVIPAATGSIAGLLTAADKTKLDGIATGANNYVHPNHTGDVTSVADGVTTITSNAVTFAKFQQIPTAVLLGRSTAGTGNVETLTLGTGLTLSSGVLSSTTGSVTSVGISGSDFTIGSSPITSSGTISLAVANNVITNTKLAQAPANTFKGNNTGATANVTDLTPSQVKTVLAYTATEVANTPAGNIAATTVQAALNELDTEKQTSVQFQEEGTNLGAAGTVTTINFTGTPVTASRSGNVVTVAISSGITPLNGDEIRTVSINTAISASTDDTVVFNTASTTATLPSPTVKKRLVVKNISTGTITVTGHIDGTASASYVLQSYEAMGFHSTASTWILIN